MTCTPYLLLGTLPTPWSAGLVGEVGPVLGLLLVAFPAASACAALWIRARRDVRRFFTAPSTLRWGEQTTIPDAVSEAFHEELRGLDYKFIGTLTEQESGSPTAVYLHAALPVYVLLTPANPRESADAERLQMESFFEGGGRLTTTTCRTFAQFTTAVETGLPRLVQLRPAGRPTALDGQHLGTLRAWIAGGRRALPASPDALIRLLEEDRARLRERVERAGWLPLTAWLRRLTGRVPGILRF